MENKPASDSLKMTWTVTPRVLRLTVATLIVAQSFAATPSATPAAKAPNVVRPAPAGRPDMVDLRYGPHERNVVDLWKAQASHPTPLVLYIHGGGFRRGDKATIPATLVNGLRSRAISVASMNYRFSEHALYPAAMLDAARAVQYLRLHAREHNLDASAFGATGGSAGAAMALWIGFHDELADAKSSDPVLRESSRLRTIVVQEAQTTLDPRVIAKIVNIETARFPTLGPFFGVPEGEDVLTASRFFLVYEASSPATYISRDDPPVLLLYRRPTAPPAPGDTMTGIHHARFGFYLKEKADAVGATCIVKTPDDYPGDVEAAQERDLIEFFAQHLGRGP
jgi:acetyl esterase